MAAPSPLQRLVTRALGEDVVDFIRRRVEAGDALTAIAEAITTRTGESVSHESVRKWANDNAIQLPPRGRRPSAPPTPPGGMPAVHAASAGP